MDFRQLRYFVTLFEEGSVTKAARRLGVVQPALSMQIRKLEEEYQTKLFERTSRGVDPTPVGKETYRRAVDILNHLRETSTFLRDSSGHVLGDLAVGMMPSLSVSALAPTLLAFNASFPEVKLRLLEAYSDNLVELLLKDALDFVVVNDEGNIRDVETIQLYTDHLVVISRPQRADEEATVTAAALSQLPLVLPSARQGMRRSLDGHLRAADVTLEPAIEMDSFNAVIELVRRSEFISVFPSLAVHRAVAAGRVKARAIVEPELHHSVVVAYNAHHPPSLAGREFIDLLRLEISEFSSHRIVEGRSATSGFMGRDSDRVSAETATRRRTDR